MATFCALRPRGLVRWLGSVTWSAAIQFIHLWSCVTLSVMAQQCFSAHCSVRPSLTVSTDRGDALVWSYGMQTVSVRLWVSVIVAVLAVAGCCDRRKLGWDRLCLQPFCVGRSYDVTVVVMIHTSLSWPWLSLTMTRRPWAIDDAKAGYRRQAPVVWL